MKEQVLAWLDKLSEGLLAIQNNNNLMLGELNEETGEYEYEFNHYGVSTSPHSGKPYIQMNDVRPLAELAGVTLQKRKFGDDGEYDYPTQYYFFYNGCEFMSLSEEPWTE